MIEIRKSNVIIYKIPEPKFVNSVGWKKDDTAVINAIAEEIRSIALDIVDVPWLGAKVSDKNHPLKVHLNSLSQWKFLLMNTKKLCNLD